MFDFSAALSSKPPATTAAPHSSQNTNGAPAEDDWNFSSALPEEAQPTSQSLAVSDKEIGIIFEVSRQKPEEPVINILAKFSNKSANAISEYTFQIAVTKVGRPRAMGVCAEWPS
jgi:hypothetical protein